ncbi:MAG: Hsp33 family molecular chaperone HslO [Treponema sp.]|nr:Hsp33 family molecular chaperone HslO [Treponema sp.]
MIKAQIQDQELNAHLQRLPKDDMVVFVLADGRARGALFHGTHFVNQMRAQHNTGILETMVLGQATLCGALLLPTLKGKEHVTWRYEVDGPAQGFSVEVDSTGYIRGYLFTDNIPVEKPLENWDLSPFLGTGTMSMSTLFEGDKNPYVSSIQIDKRNIAQDLVQFFDQSVQTKTAFNTGIQMDKQGRVVGAGGLFLQLMPDMGGTKGSKLSTAAISDDQLIDKLEIAFKTLPSLGKWFSEGQKLEDLVYGLFREFKPSIALHRDVRFDCPCSKDLYLNHIKNLPAQELSDIRKNGPDPLEVCCRNCSSVYRIPISEI